MMLPNVGPAFGDLLPTCCPTLHIGPKIGDSNIQHAQLSTLVIDSTSGQSLAGTVMDIPFDPTSSPQYLIVFNDGTTRAVLTTDMPSLIATCLTAATNASHHLLPPFLQLGSKITLVHEGQYCKGFLGQSLDGTYRFKKSEDWGVPLPNLPSTWQDQCTDGSLIPGHQPSLILHVKHQSPTLESASHVSMVNLHRECPNSLLAALHPTHSDCDTWVVSFHEDKSDIISQQTYLKQNIAKYHAL